MKIALIDIPNTPAHSTKTEVPSLSLGYLAAVLLEAGHQVVLLDSPKWKQSYERSYAVLLKEKPDIAGFTSTTQNRFQTMRLMTEVKKAFSPLVIAGGPHFTFTAVDALEQVPALDAIVRGEGERSLLEIIDAYTRHLSFADIKGVTWRDADGRVVSNPERPFITDLNSLPPPAWHLFDLSQYHDILDTTSLKVIGLMSSRGCPQRCSFCANAVMGKATLRFRDPKKVVDEIELLHNTYGYKAFKFSDDTLTMNKEHIMSICNEILRRELKITWSARVRVNTVDEERLRMMRKAGCISLLYGIESGSPRILQKMHKEIDFDQVRKAIRLSSEIGFETISASFMVSYPGETNADMDMTFALMKELQRIGPHVKTPINFTLIYPGTEVEKQAREEGVLPVDFSWNTPHTFPKYFIAQCQDTEVYYESKDRPLEEIRAYISRHYYTFAENLKRSLSFLRRVRTLSDLPVLIRLIKKVVCNR